MVVLCLVSCGCVLLLLGGELVGLPMKRAGLSFRRVDAVPWGWACWESSVWCASRPVAALRTVMVAWLLVPTSAPIVWSPENWMAGLSVAAVGVDAGWPFSALMAG